MSKAKKEQTIKAIEVIILRYRNPIGINPLEGTRSCPLCKIHAYYRDGYVMRCNGCPFANNDNLEGSVNCSSSKTYSMLAKLVGNCMIDGPHQIITKELFSSSAESILNKAANALEYLIELLEPVPSKYFTRKGWKSFELLDLEEDIINRKVKKLTFYE